MTGPEPRCGYEIRIKGRLRGSLQGAFAGLNVTVKPVETVVWGPDLDQAALYGVLEQVHALGLDLIEVRRLPDPNTR
ncbi:hypothetical protein [Actinomadura sp. NTSP31]|uniref:hypothetical protein n=1 Tax=Actinomadura sp. NTSP31 TaxID=1735447 RepID=UPI0035C26008